MFHLAGWTQSVDTAGVLTAHSAIADPVLTISGNDVRIPEDLNNLIGAYAGGSANLTRAQLQSPSLRRVLNFEVEPLDASANPTSPPVIDWFPDSPQPLDKLEALDFFAAENAAGAARQTGFAWLADGALKADDRPYFSVRVTAAVTLVAFGWTNAALTFDQTLPAGTYDIVGARFRSATGVAFRFVFVGGGYRPGFLMFPTAGGYDLPYFRAGNAGVIGTFKHTTPPTVDFFATAGDTSETGELDLVKVA